MKCLVPKYSGFCFDVSAAVKTAYEHTDNSTYMYGEVVNNPIVVKDLQSKGLTLVHDLDSIPKKPGLKVLVRAHGLPESAINDITRRGYEIVDRTCPKVKKVHSIVAEASRRGMDIVLVGTPNHPETDGIMGWAKTRVALIQNLEQAKSLVSNTVFSANGVCLVAQTIHNKKVYEEIKKHFVKMAPGVEIHDTICDSTERRQTEIRYLAKAADGFIVVGGHKSSNVGKLYDIASEHCGNIQRIESEKELDLTKLNGVNTLVVAGGASTPDTSVNEIVSKVKSYCDDCGILFETSKNLFFHNW